MTEANVAVVSQICSYLDGLPLAIELAAARMPHLPPESLLARLERRLSLLTGGTRDAPVRQRTMRGANAWSHDLLLEEERRFFRRLGEFRGGFTLDSAEYVAKDLIELEIDVVEEIGALVSNRRSGSTQRVPSVGQWGNLAFARPEVSE